MLCSWCEPYWACELARISEDLSYLMVYTVMPAIFIVLWRIFVTNRSPGVLVLGLEESSLPRSEVIAPKSRLTIWKLLLYVLAGVITFEIGLGAFDVVQSFR
jgi:hypothetical protein